MSPRNVAFLVGIDRFVDATFAPLRYCQNDIEGMGRVLSNPETCGFEILELHNKTRDEILESLDRTAQSLNPDDKLLFYFAGHGRRSPQSGRLYLVATNTKSDALRATGILIDDALNIIRESRCTNRALVLDCCHSGAIGEAFRGGDITSGLSDLARNFGTYILTASTAIELAAERESASADGSSGNGLFTKYFIEAVEAGNSSSDEGDAITIDSVYRYIQQHLSVDASQIPQRFVIGGAGNFVVGRSSAFYWERRRKELLARFRELIDQNVISDNDYIAAAKLFRTSWSSLTPDWKLRARIGIDVLDGKTSVSDFLSGFREARIDPRPSVSWRAKLIERTRNHFSIELACSDGTIHRLERSNSMWRAVETLVLDGVVIGSTNRAGNEFYNFSVGSHPTRFHVQFQTNSFQRLWNIELRVDDKLVLSTVDQDRPTDKGRAITTLVLIVATVGFVGALLGASWTALASACITLLGLGSTILGMWLKWRPSIRR